MKKQAPWLAYRLKILDIMVLVAALAGTLLGALRLKELIPIAVAVSSSLTQVIQFSALHSRVAAVQSSIVDLSQLNSRWRSMRVIDQNLPGTKRLFVDTAERAMLRVVEAYVAGAAQFSVKTSDGAEDDADKEKGDGRKEDDKKPKKQV